MATKSNKTNKTVSTKKTTRSTKKRSQKPEYWFAAKRYGYGWGRALVWQGWVVYLTFLAAFVWYFAWASNRVAAEQTFGLGQETFLVAGFFMLLAVALPVLVAICMFKGEPAHWRWGTKKQ